MRKTHVLAGFISEHELAKQLGRHTRTVATWRKSKVGPGVTMLGRLPFYSEKNIHDWLAAGGVSGVQERAASRRSTRSRR
jgi:hypothetical protein